MTQLFDSPYMYWVGLDTPAGATEADLVEFNRFYDEVHAPEVLAAYPGMTGVTRFELVMPDPRNDYGPRWLSAYEFRDHAAVEEYLRRDPVELDYTAGPSTFHEVAIRWRLIWKKRVSSGDAGVDECATLFMVGMSPPAGSSPSEVAEFDRFYTDVHIGEVLGLGPFARGSRFELETELVHQEPGAPRFVATYEAAGSRPWEGIDPQAVFDDGPSSWQRRDVRWRLFYRRLTTTSRTDGGPASIRSEAR